MSILFSTANFWTEHIYFPTTFNYSFNYSYDSTTGTFTVPSSGDGFYYFSTYLLVESGEYGRFNIEINGETLCTGQTDEQDSLNGQVACSAATYAMTGWLIDN